MAYHRGEAIGFRTAPVRLLNQRLIAIVLTNRCEAKPLEIALTLLERSAEG